MRSSSPCTSWEPSDLSGLNPDCPPRLCTVFPPWESFYDGSHTKHIVDLLYICFMICVNDSPCALFKYSLQHYFICWLMPIIVHSSNTRNVIQAFLSWKWKPHEELTIIITISSQ
jgi:hypothetical protein